MRDEQEWHSRLGGRKFLISLLGLALTVVLAKLGATSEAYVALGTIVLSYCGGNAVVEWSHKGTSTVPPFGAKTDPDA